MKNKYLANLEKIEFVITYACTGRCKHCSEGEHIGQGKYIDGNIAYDAVKKIASVYDIKTVMTFGGEPLLYPDVVCEIMRAALEMNITKRQIITNGYFTADNGKICDIVERLVKSGVNEILLSVDAFHQETIPLDVVKVFALKVKEHGITIKLQPAWLVSCDNDNEYNRKTREILDSFSELEIYENAGNVIFPEGNAKKFLSEYFVSDIPENPYVEDALDVHCVSFSPDGDVLDSNVYEYDIMNILENYNP